MQRDIFLKGEADNWFLRNEKALRDGEANEITWLCEQIKPFNVSAALEIGCSNGAKLRQICRTLECAGSGVDPSQKAVDDGKSRGGLDLRVGSAASLPFADESFDVAYFGFCLYLLDRADLPLAVAEANRVLKPGGFLAITDFDPARQHKRDYKHAPGVFTHKQDYSICFTSTGLYHLVAKRSMSHRLDYFDADSDERIATSVLYKEL